MGDNFTRHSFEKVINVEKIITIFYMEKVLFFLQKIRTFSMTENPNMLY